MARITLADLAALDYCRRGTRDWFTSHGIDWSAFVSHGIDAETLSHIDDPMLQAAIQRAAQREQQEISSNGQR